MRSHTEVGDRVRVRSDGGSAAARKYAGEWELPVLGAVTAPTAVLIRPDGYVAWVGGRHRYRTARRADSLVRSA